MPHLIIQYSTNLTQRADIKIFCEQMKHGLLSLNLYPAAGIRVRAAPQDDYVIADSHPENSFLDMTLRIGAGRTEAQKKASGTALFDTAKAFFAKELARGHFMISLDIVEIDAALSWKHNPIRDRMQSERI